MAKDVTTLLKATAGYLKGKVEDGETDVNEELYNDIIQFFVKLLDDASITASGDYDNETNGYQFIDALEDKIIETTGGLTTKIISIGDWDMNATTKINVAHGISDITKIRDVRVIIRNDADTIYSPLTNVDIAGGGSVNGGMGFLDATSIGLVRTVGGDYDSVNYANTPYNRGYIIFKELA